MTIPGLSLISNFCNPRPRHVVGRQHLMLAGITQTVFINQWGEPETQIGFNPLGTFYKLGSLFLIADPTGEVHHSVWIYKKRDRILFFTKRRLTSHFKWSEFREKCERPKEESSLRMIRKPSFFTTTTLSMVA